MEYTIKNLPHSEIEISFELAPEELEKFRQQAVLKIGKEIKIEGFRQGHVPEEIIEQRVGKMVILEEAAEIAISETYQRAVKEISEKKNITPIDKPRVEILKLAPGNPLEFKITVCILPQIELPDYRKIASGLEKKKIVISEKDLNDSLGWLQKSRAKFSPRAGQSQKGDFLEIEYNSVQIDSGKKYQDAFILGEGRFVPGFEENLEGLVADQEKNFSVNFPQDHPQKDLSGRKIDFGVKVKSVQKMDLPQLDDEFAKSLGNFKDMSSLKENIKEGLQSEKEKQESDRLRNEILEEISAAIQCEIPQVLIDSEKHRDLHELKHRVSDSLKITFEEYLSKIKKSEKDLLDSFEDQAKKKVKGSLILKALSEKEGVLVLEEEIKEEMSNFLRAYPDIKTAQKEFDPERLREYTKEAILNEKTFKLLEGFAK